jgi:hypothetical protein
MAGVRALRQFFKLLATAAGAFHQIANLKVEFAVVAITMIGCS